MIKELEDKMVPKGSIDLVGLGRLNIRVGINLIQVHRGGPKKISVFDGQEISSADIIFTLLGAKDGEYKTDFFKRICTHKKEFREINAVSEDIDENNLHLITGDVVVIGIAGGNTIPTTAKIIKHAHKNNKKTISTGGIFGFGDEEVIIKDISEFDDSNPAVEELRKEGITENHLIVSTSKFIRDMEPISPFILDEVAKKLTINALKLLDG